MLRLRELADSPGDPQPGFTLLADGRVITVERDFQPSPQAGVISGYPYLYERRLTSAGLDLIVRTVEGTGFFDRDGTFSATLLPGAQPPGHGGGLQIFTFQTRGRPITVQNIPFFDPTYYAPAPPTQRLLQLADELRSLERWLPSEAWVEARRMPYQPHNVAVFIASPSPFGPGTPRDLTELERLLGARLTAFGSIVRSDGLRCGVVTGTQFAALLDLLNRGSQQPFAPHASAPTFVVTTQEGGPSFALVFALLLPDAPASCTSVEPSWIR